MSDSKALTAKQEAFARNYVANGFNATQAAISAGYSESTANEIGSENLAKPSIKARIDELMASTVEKTRIGAEEIYEFASRGAFFDIGDVLEMDEAGAFLRDGKKLSDLPKEVRQLIQTVKSKPTAFGVVNEIIFVDKLRLLEMLARFNGMNKDSLKVENPHEGKSLEELAAILKAKREAGIE